MNYQDLFNSIYPRFFEQEFIRSLPAEEIYSEQVLRLEAFDPESVRISCPDRILFHPIHGAAAGLREAVRQVDPDWVQYFTEERKFFCAADGERIASFCILDDMGRHQGLHVGGPGCVGTVPEYRRQGIGLEMVRRATAYLQQNGFDLSLIHYTQVDRWYARLGYETVLRWNRDGILWEKDRK